VNGVMRALPHHTADLGGGVFQIDTGFQRPRFDAAYLVVDDGHAAFIDTGTAFAVPNLLEALAATGLTRHQVDWIIPTHVHLDHAGGVGALMQHLPQAQVLVHPRGLRHLVDPSALYQGALAVYGQAEMDRSYGQLQGVAADRVVPSQDGMSLVLGQRTLSLIDTPGHARHHHCVWDPVTRGWFTGDTFGLSYREHDVAGKPWILPTTTPVQFEPEVLRTSVQRLLAHAPEHIYLTHFGRVDQVPALGQAMLALLDEVVALGEKLRHVSERDTALRQGLQALYLRSLRSHGCTLPETTLLSQLDLDIELNAQGMGIWLDRRA
jgi:glyoxylase-like metal-dependent hydrolase (beta-lactamase superfamily II)